MKRAHLIQVVGGDEHDAFTGWRRVLSFRPGERKRIKRGCATCARLVSPNSCSPTAVWPRRLITATSVF